MFEGIQRAAKRVLDTIPLDGEKTKAALWALGLCVLKMLLPDLPWPADVDPVAAAEYSTLAVGLALYHRYLKKRFPRLPI